MKEETAQNNQLDMVSRCAILKLWEQYVDYMLESDRNLRVELINLILIN